MIISASKIEFHYYFHDRSHTMSAFVRNECERELLAIFREITTSLDINIAVESEAFTEGGLKELWKFIGDKSGQLTVIVTLLGIIVSRIPVENKELVNLQIENLMLDNELKREELRQIKNKVKDTDELKEDIIKELLEILDNNYKILWHKSNFYKRLSIYQKVAKFSTQILNERNEPLEDENVVERPQFGSFILRSDTFPPNIDEGAIIDIISPVLKKGHFSWKGFYKGEIINFAMADIQFKEAVLNKEIEFINGTAIKCILYQTRRIEETGLVKIVQSKVLTVFELINNDGFIETEQGRKHKRDKQLANNQLTINF